jgi:hypothetical protein
VLDEIENGVKCFFLHYKVCLHKQFLCADRTVSAVSTQSSELTAGVFHSLSAVELQTLISYEIVARRGINFNSIHGALQLSDQHKVGGEYFIASRFKKSFLASSVRMDIKIARRYRTACSG